MCNDQLSFLLSPDLVSPFSYTDIVSLWKNYVAEPEDDDDAFSFEPIASGYSFFIYGKKAFELQKSESLSTLRIPGGLVRALDPSRCNLKAENLYVFTITQSDQLSVFIEWLRKLKRENFRALVSDTFACCNSFVQCSDAGHCIHENDRFYNGCYYRTNLEQGRFFYGKNKNI